MNSKRMMPIGPLMIEHRLIERTIEILKREWEQIKAQKKVDHALIDEMVDFIRTYADRCHHGKEEDILFRDAEKKDLAGEHKVMLRELIEEHAQARQITKTLIEANDRNRQGDGTALAVIDDCLKQLVEFYPKHIEKEDKHFFLPLMKYFSDQEKEAMLEEELDFDRKLIHEKYEALVIKEETMFGIQKKRQTGR